MKVWFQAGLDYGDIPVTCCKCGKIVSAPDIIFIEHQVLEDRVARPTEKIRCAECGKELV